MKIIKKAKKIVRNKAVQWSVLIFFILLVLILVTYRIVVSEDNTELSEGTIENYLEVGDMYDR